MRFSSPTCHETAHPGPGAARPGRRVPAALDPHPHPRRLRNLWRHIHDDVVLERVVGLTQPRGDLGAFKAIKDGSPIGILGDPRLLDIRVLVLTP